MEEGLFLRGKNMEQTKYIIIYQNLAINNLAFLIPGIKDLDWDSHLDRDGRVKFTYGNVIYKLDASRKSKPLSARTHQVLMYIISKYTSCVRQASSDKWIEEHLKITLPFEEIARDFDMSLHAVKPMVMLALDFLYDLDIYAYWKRGRSNAFRKAHAVESFVLDTHDVTRKGYATVLLDKSFAKFLSFMSVIQYPNNLWKIPVKYHCSAFQMGHLMVMRNKMNFLKRNWNRISVEDFLEHASSIPKKTSLGRAKQYRQRIIVPFIREINLLVQFGILEDWKFLCDNRHILYDNIKFLDYDDFEKGIIEYTLSGKPEQTYVKRAVRTALSPQQAHYKSPNSDGDTDEYIEPYYIDCVN